MKSVYSNAAIVFGSGGGIGKAIKQELLSGNAYKNVICYSKSNDILLDITDENAILKAAYALKKKYKN